MFYLKGSHHPGTENIMRVMNKELIKSCSSKSYFNLIFAFYPDLFLAFSRLSEGLTYVTGSYSSLAVPFAIKHRQNKYKNIHTSKREERKRGSMLSEKEHTHRLSSKGNSWSNISTSLNGTRALPSGARPFCKQTHKQTRTNKH